MKYSRSFFFLGEITRLSTALSKLILNSDIFFFLFLRDWLTSKKIQELGCPDIYQSSGEKRYIHTFSKRWVHTISKCNWNSNIAPRTSIHDSTVPPMKIETKKFVSTKKQKPCLKQNDAENPMDRICGMRRSFKEDGNKMIVTQRIRKRQVNFYETQ